MFYGLEHDGIQLDKLLFTKYCGYTKGFFIECGAYDGVYASNCKFLEDNLHWTGINIEPHPVQYKKLVVNRPNCINLNVALSNKQREAKFFVNNNKCSACGSIDKCSDVIVKYLNNDLSEVENYEVKTDTYENIINTYNVQKIDLFVLDVEGHEIEILDSMENSKVLPKIFCIEYGHVGFDVIKSKVIKLNYEVDFTDSINVIFKQKVV